MIGRSVACTAVAATAALVASPVAAAPRVATVDDFARLGAPWHALGGSRLQLSGPRDARVVRVTAPRGKSGGLRRTLPARPWSLSVDIRPSRKAVVSIEIGRGDRTTALRADGNRVWATTADGRRVRVRRTSSAGGWYRLEVATGRGGLALDGHVLGAASTSGRTLTLTVVRGEIALRSVVVSGRSDPAGLLVHRLASLQMRTPAGRFPLGTGLDGRLRFGRGWTTGFWAGSLWQAFDLTGSRLFARWALDATLQNLGNERADTHDLGFMYESSSVAAYERLCRSGSPPRVCARLRASAIKAADSLMALAATNAPAGMIPTRSQTLCRGCASADEADTIIDSVMNLSLLTWASRETGDRRYADVAARHAANVARLLVRPDGSTIQSVHTRRSDGAVVRFHTHQGMSDDSTWSRGQAWAIYGFAVAARELSNPELLQVADRAAAFVRERMPTPAIPPYDYASPPGAPRDTSAGVITAAGLYRLADACDEAPGVCTASTSELRRYAEGLLKANLASVRRSPPLGLFGSQVYGLGGSTTWDDDAELIFGVYYALEAVGLSRVSH